MQTVLVVDAHIAARSLITTILEARGYLVIPAGSAEAALEIASSTAIDLVIIDVDLPDTNGWQIAAQLRGNPASARCRQILISGAPLGSDLTRPDLEIDAHLTRPFTSGRLTAAVRDVLSGPRRAFPGIVHGALLDSVLSQRQVVSRFQPIVDLDTRKVIGVESLARGPDGPLQMPDALFDTARQTGRVHELDTLCQVAALTGAQAAVPVTPPLVFINIEPSSADRPIPPELRTLSAGLPFQIVAEFTERTLIGRLPALMRYAEEVRAQGHLVALDDVGVDPRSVALLPLLEPEIVKLDMSPVQDHLTAAAATTEVAVAAYAERTGACVIAEGIETEGQVAAAIGMGAHWGQGWLFGRPEPLSRVRTMDVARTRRQFSARARPLGTPFELATQGRTPRLATIPLLDGVSQQLELQARAVGDVGVLLPCVQDAARVPTLARRGYAQLAAAGATVGILGRGVDPEPLPGVYGAGLRDDDPLCHEWVLTVLGPHESATLTARDLGNSGPRSQRRFEFVLSHDRELAEIIARSLARRFSPRSTIARTSLEKPL